MFEQPGNKYVAIVGYGEKLQDYQLNPAKYRLELNNVSVDNVPIEAGKNTGAEPSEIVVGAIVAGPFGALVGRVLSSAVDAAAMAKWGKASGKSQETKPSSKPLPSAKKHPAPPPPFGHGKPKSATRQRRKRPPGEAQTR